MYSHFVLVVMPIPDTQSTEPRGFSFGKPLLGGDGAKATSHQRVMGTWSSIFNLRIKIMKNDNGILNLINEVKKDVSKEDSVENAPRASTLVSTTKVYTAKVSTAKVFTAKVSTAEVSIAKVSTAEVSTAEVSTAGKKLTTMDKNNGNINLIDERKKDENKENSGLTVDGTPSGSNEGTITNNQKKKVRRMPFRPIITPYFSAMLPQFVN